MTHNSLKKINGIIYSFLGLCMVWGSIVGILRYTVRPIDVSPGYTLSIYVTDTVLLQNGLGMALLIGGLALIAKGVFMVLHSIVDKRHHDKEDR